MKIDSEEKVRQVQVQLSLPHTRISSTSCSWYFCSRGIRSFIVMSPFNDYVMCEREMLQLAFSSRLSTSIAQYWHVRRLRTYNDTGQWWFRLLFVLQQSDLFGSGYAAVVFSSAWRFIAEGRRRRRRRVPGGLGGDGVEERVEYGRPEQEGWGVELHLKKRSCCSQRCHFGGVNKRAVNL